MPPRKSLIAELLAKQTKAEEAERDLSVDLNGQESSYYDLDLLVANDDARCSQSLTAAVPSTTDQVFPAFTEETQKNAYQRPLHNISMISHNFLELSNSGSAELPTGSSRDSMNSHDAFEIFAWNQSKSFSEKTKRKSAKIFGKKACLKLQANIATALTTANLTDSCVCKNTTL